MKKSILFLFFVLFFVACKEDEPVVPAPVISGLEVGSNNSKTVQRGKDLHLEAQLTAEGTLASVKVNIHPKSGAGWTFSKDIAELVGKKNGEIHMHIDIPATTAPGEYHVDIEVKDQNGRVTEAESDLSITA